MGSLSGGGEETWSRQFQGQRTEIWREEVTGPEQVAAGVRDVGVSRGWVEMGADPRRVLGVASQKEQSWALPVTDRYAA